METVGIILLSLFMPLVFTIIGAALMCAEDEKKIRKIKQELFDVSRELEKLRYEKSISDRMTLCSAQLRQSSLCENEKYKKALITLLKGAVVSIDPIEVHTNCGQTLFMGNTVEISKDNIKFNDYKFILDVAQEVGVWK